MGFKEMISEWSGGDLTFLSEDGETVIFVVADDPVQIVGKYRGNETKRVGVPIFTDEGQSLLIIGMRIARRLSKYEASFGKSAFALTRIGDKGDTKTSYKLSVVEDVERTKSLLELRKKGLDKAELKASIDAAMDAANG